MTNLPVSNFKSGRSDSMPEMNGRSKYATTGRRTHSIKARNLYRVGIVGETRWWRVLIASSSRSTSGT
jgi:hypothetical protein